MSTISFRDCAVEYAGYWAKHERHFVEELGASDEFRRLEALRQASGYFKIARNFPLRHDEGAGFPRLQPVLSAIDRISKSSVTPDALGGIINSLRHELGRSYGGRDLLSAATKFLWLRHREVVIIFDSQARLALGTRPSDYDGYLERWYSGYADCKSAIRHASAEIAPSVGRPNLALGRDREFREVASAEWFHRRVYDIYLWRLGGPAQFSAVT